MAKQPTDNQQTRQFILKHIDSVPQLEALLLLWNSSPRFWSASEVADRLYISPQDAKVILQDLTQRRLLQSLSETEAYFYQPSSEEQDRLIAAVDETYRKEIVPISTMIHSKASRAVRDFAQAFKFTKERE